MSKVAVAKTTDFTNLGGYSVGRYKKAKGLSEDTIAFDAALMLSGKKIATVTNNGQGGCHNYNFAEVESRDAFFQTAKNLYGEFEAEDRLFDELVVRYQMVNVIAPKNIKHNRAVIVLTREKPQHLSTIYACFDEEYFTSCATMEAAIAELEKFPPDEYVIYDSTTDSFTAKRYTPSKETSKEVKKAESRRAEEFKRRQENWSQPEPMAECPRFQLSSNEEASVKIFDSETGREAVVGLYAFSEVKNTLNAFFGAQSTG